jgi:hypothetical protein
MLGAFENWPTFIAQLYKLSETRNSQGQIVRAYTATGSPITVWKWISRSVATNSDDRFINDELGKIAFIPTTQAYNIDDYFLIDNEKYYIIGIEPDIMGFTDVAVIDYRRENGFRR